MTKPKKDRAFAIRVLRRSLEALEVQAHDVKRRIDLLRPLELQSRTDLMAEGRGIAREHAATERAILDLESDRFTPAEIMIQLAAVRRRERPDLSDAAAEVVRLSLIEEAA